MPGTHHYATELTWTGNTGSGTASYRSYARTCEVRVDGKPTLAGSSDPHFRGDADRWNPEELLVAALSQCHLLAFLHEAAVGGVVVVDYTDAATGTMRTQGNGGRMTGVTLRPVVTVAAPEMAELCAPLHERAHANCFIAASVNFPVRHEPQIMVAAEEPPVSTVPPVRREILVNANLATAFAVFTDDIGRWWPVAEYSVYGAGGTVTLANSEIVERSAGGHSALWGTITRWEPPVAAAFTWHPGQTADRASHVEVTFAAAGDQTLVTLSHRGWDTFDDPAGARADYDQGWPVVLGCYRGHFATLLPPPGAPAGAQG
jgi:organic hydroperoxide reductase OsmC/OhrA